MKIILKRGREKAVLNRHHWIFSGAISRIEGPIENGEIISVCDSEGSLLGFGYFNSRSDIRVRMISFGTRQFDINLLSEFVSSAIKKRKINPLLKNTNAYRLIYSEGDSIPGLIVDQYAKHLVVQILTLGIKMLRDDIIHILVDTLKPESIYERSDHAGRRIEGLDDECGQLYGITPDEIEIIENGIKFIVDVKRGQKTGFFLDQRENRELACRLSEKRSVLDLFCNTGGFSLSAIKGGAISVISVDSSADALERAKKNLALNNFSGNYIFCCDDVFDYLRKNEIKNDFIIIDPPAFAKSSDSVNSASRGYKDINLLAIKKCPPDTFILSCSCSRFIDMILFQKILFSAALDAGRRVSILGKAHHPSDHNINIYHPEGEYLKSVLMCVE